ncbi:DUF2235 domain-containing protein [Parasphingorhabdus sp. DH2-15]|uniref:DUF2235 domain-containing protein n=1 Tax=Parasphingorhabdus sp. DH2-15 TaxID=3444112 RepID=UPI003F688308
MKRLIYCFDGTWNRLVEGEQTNVPRIAQMACNIDNSDPNKPVHQMVYYDEGVGTYDFGNAIDWVLNRLAGIFGLGLDQNIQEAYTHLILNFVPGDEIYVFGFSRGAFTARSFVGLIGKVGVLRKNRLFKINDAIKLYRNGSREAASDSPMSLQFRSENSSAAFLPSDRKHYIRTEQSSSRDLKIAYMGIWDTVGAMGIPSSFLLSNILNRKHRFHDTDLSPFVERARHALAADERRVNFAPTLWRNLGKLNSDCGEKRYRQRIFPGTHSGVGGGGPERGLSDRTLQWIMEGAELAGLTFDKNPDSGFDPICPNPTVSIFTDKGKTSWSIGDFLLGGSLEPRNFENFQMRAEADDERTAAQQEFESCELDETISERWNTDFPAQDKPRYRPESLRSYWPYLKYLAGRDIQYKGQAPDSLTLHKVNNADSWEGIAQKYYGNADEADALLRFNQDCEIVETKEGLLMGREVLIPHIAKPETCSIRA